MQGPARAGWKCLWGILCIVSTPPTTLRISLQVFYKQTKKKFRHLMFLMFSLFGHSLVVHRLKASQERSCIKYPTC
jgi:hypothetical protein